MDDDGYDAEFFSIDRILEDEEINEARFRVNESEQTQQLAHDIVIKHRPQLKLEQRRMIVDNLLAMLVEKELPYGSVSKLARQVGVHKSTIGRIYKATLKQMERGQVIDVR